MTTSNTVKKVGFVGLTMMVIGSMIGGGIFNIPQTIAHNSSLGAVLIAWGITAIGMMGLAFTFKYLSEQKSELSTGIYSYARAGFGRYIGFNSAWGYWVSSACGNVSFAIMLNDSLGYFFPSLLEHGWPTIILGTGLLWSYNLLVSKGIKQAALMNSITVILKFITIFVILLTMAAYFNFDFAKVNFWGEGAHLGSLSEQIKGPMLVTLWCFVGIEGAVVISGRAEHPKHVGWATVIGFLVALTAYVALSILAYGIDHQQTLSQLADPSVGYVLTGKVGNWFTTFVNIAIIISVGGAWIAWTVLVSEVPYAAAKDGVLPKLFANTNNKGVAKTALNTSSIIMTLVLLLVVTAKNAYLATIDITGVIILPPYLLSSLYLWKLAAKKEVFSDSHKLRNRALITGIIASIYCGWLLYAANISYFLFASIVYTVGIFFFYKARKENTTGEEPLFLGYEKILAIAIVLTACLATYLLLTHQITI